MTTFWLQLMFVQLVMSSGSGRHSLWFLATYISGPTQLPEFSGVLMLDDLQVGYYDSTLDHLVSNSREQARLDLGQNALEVLQHIKRSMRNRLTISKHRNNQTEGIHVQQRVTGCEIRDGQPTFILYRDAYDGQDIGSLMFNTTHFLHTNGNDSQWDAMKWHFVQTLYQDFYFPTCMTVLKQLMDQKKNLVTRRVKPRLRIFSKQVNGGALLTCLATDFYPRNINITLFRDGLQVEEDQLSSGPVLPNGNGLYQVRKTLELTDEELQQKHSYTCSATHLSLDNQLQVTWRAKSYNSHPAYWVSPLIVMLATALLLILVVVKCRKAQDPGAQKDSQKEESVSMMTQSVSSTDRPPEDAT